mgnify:CR=1 FL=1
MNSDFEDRDNIGVAEPSRGFGFLKEANAHVLVFQLSRGDNLQRHLTAKHLVSRDEYLTVTALADEAHHFEVTHNIAWLDCQHAGWKGTVEEKVQQGESGCYRMVRRGGLIHERQGVSDPPACHCLQTHRVMTR